MADLHRVVLWVGSMACSEFDGLFEERYTEDGDSQGSDFSRALGLAWLDHDLIERDCQEDEASIADLVTDLSYYEAFIDRALSAARVAGIEHANFVVAVFDEDVPEIEMVNGTRFACIGSFSFSCEFD